MSKHPISPELAARLTAAQAALADYRRAEATPDDLNWGMWAGRLAAALESVLDGVATGPRPSAVQPLTGPGVVQPGGGWISGPSR